MKAVNLSKCLVEEDRGKKEKPCYLTDIKVRYMADQQPQAREKTLEKE